MCDSVVSVNRPPSTTHQPPLMTGHALPQEQDDGRVRADEVPPHRERLRLSESCPPSARARARPCSSEGGWRSRVVLGCGWGWVWLSSRMGWEQDQGGERRRRGERRPFPTGILWRVGVRVCERVTTRAKERFQAIKITEKCRGSVDQKEVRKRGRSNADGPCTSRGKSGGQMKGAGGSRHASRV